RCAQGAARAGVDKPAARPASPATTGWTRLCKEYRTVVVEPYPAKPTGWALIHLRRAATGKTLPRQPSGPRRSTGDFPHTHLAPVGFADYRSTHPTRSPDLAIS
ncbi:MAG: hypothetical protein NTW19_13450, partial [Planctomycetota bacterium]|nr:hypothetical protein [Planctomycetota bacterium]